MKTKCVFLIVLLTLLIALSGCGVKTYYNTPATDANIPDTTHTMFDAWREAADRAVEPAVVEHGEDYVISWEDPGMEARVRALVEKPEGEVLHSDVWNLDSLEIVAEKDIPNPKHLRDLRHFDSLQSLGIDLQEIKTGFNGMFPSNSKEPIDLSGLENCRHLRYLGVGYVSMLSLEPLSDLKELVSVSLYRCGAVDLTPIANLPELSRIYLGTCDLTTLEPLTTLPKLYMLRLASECTYPSLEPLARTRVQYLDMFQSYGGRKMYADMDYTPLSQMPQLIWLDLTNHSHLDQKMCEKILENAPELKYLDISYTKAVKNSAFINTEQLEFFGNTP